jgi:hypothetical protein
VGFLESLNFYLAKVVGDPLRRLRFIRPEENLGRGLRQHRLRIVTVASLKLAAPLKAEHDGIFAFPILRQGCMQLGKPLQAGHLINEKPDTFLVFVPHSQQMQDEHIQPHAMQGSNGFVRLDGRGQEYPAVPILTP